MREIKNFRARHREIPGAPGQGHRWRGLQVRLALNRGVADRLVVLPQGVVWFVEVKKEGGRLSTLQNIFAAEMVRLQQNISIVWSKEDVDDLIKEMQS